MLRTIRDILSLVCLPVLVVVLIMWARSYVVIDRLVYRSMDGQDCRLRSDSGHVTYFWTTAVFPNKKLPTEWIANYLPACDPLVNVWESIGFYHEYAETPKNLLGKSVDRSLTMIPYWFLALLVGIAPTGRIWEYRRKKSAAGMSGDTRVSNGNTDECG